VKSLRLLLRNLLYFRGVNIAVLIGMAVATAVLSGALMVGDSVRASLVELALRRLGAVDDALISTRFFDESLGPRVAGRAKDFDVSPTIITQGAAADETSNTRTADVQIAAGAWTAVPPGQCIINGELADALGVASVGESIVLSVPTDSDAPRESALDRRSRGDTISGLRVQVTRIVREPGMLSLFNPNGGQRTPRNAWVNLGDLQDAMNQTGRVNALLAHGRSGDDTNLLNDALDRALTLSDEGLTTTEVLSGTMLAVGSRTTYLPPQVVTAADAAATATHVPLQKISVNLLTAVHALLPPLPVLREREQNVIHYAVVAGVTPLEGQTLGLSEAALNQWTAEALGVAVGDSIRIDFYERGPAGDLRAASAGHPASELTFKVARVLPMTGLGADSSLPPDYKGLTDADSVADWNPPEGLKIDKSLVTKADETYWKQYRAAPKIFVSFETAGKLWGGVYGQVTGLRVPSQNADAFLAALGMALPPASLGMTFRPIKAQQLAAASGGTDFGQYFLYFSFFLIVAAVLLAAMLFRLGVEQRARQLGLLAAIGFAPRRIRRLALAEGLVLAVIGGAVGAAGSIAYTWLIMAGLRTWWIGAVGTTAMQLDVRGETLAIGYFSGVLVAMGAVWWGAWRVGRVPAANLLAGSWENAIGRTGRSGRILRMLGLVGMLAGLGMLAAAMMHLMPTDVAFLGGGGLLLCSVLLWLGGALRPRGGRHVGFIGAGSVLRLGVRNASRHTARGVLAVGLIAFAVFTLIVVAVMRQGSGGADDDRRSGTGGYCLILQAGIPILTDLNSVEGRKLAGIRNPGDAVWSDVRFTPMRRWAGQDISCLNLTQPTSPTILSVPPAMVDRAAFTAANTIAPAANFWTLLASDRGDAVPVIADDDTANYILKVPVGGELTIADQSGQSRKLILVATISHSIFQSELLMGEANFRRLFPGEGGFGVMLIDCPQGDEQTLRQGLGAELDEYSVSVDTTAGRLAAYQAVANTYLATFQTLGSFGLLLGTVGLGVVLVRTVLERRPELALLACLGFKPAGLAALVLAENVFLLLLGLIVGTACAVIGVLPAMIASGRGMNLSGLALTLASVVIVGVAASLIAVRLCGANISPADLRRE
jgi:ABC-type antimicrobial peptide transport system permease subunit